MAFIDDRPSAQRLTVTAAFELPADLPCRCSYFLRQRIAQPIEDEVADDEHQQRRRRRPPATRRHSVNGPGVNSTSWYDDRQMRERIQVQQPLHRRGACDSG